MDAIIRYGSLPMRLDGERISDAPAGALDQSSVRYLAPYPGWKAALSGEGISKGSQYAGQLGLWVKDFKLQGICGDTAEVEIALEGLLSGNGDKRIRKISASGNVISVGPLEKIIVVPDAEGEYTDQDADPPTPSATEQAQRRVPKLNADGTYDYRSIATPTGTAERWNVKDPIITVIDEYFTTTAPDVDEVNTAIAPVMAPVVPLWQWAAWAYPMRFNHPAGWVLEARNADQLYGPVGDDGLWKVTDVSSYYYTGQPD